MIYFDNSATTKPNEEVLASFIDVTKKFFANPSSIHQLGGESEKLLSVARGQVANILQVDSGEVVFTSGGTEANNLALKGVVSNYASRGKHIVTTAVEHPSVYENFQLFENEGFDVTYLPVNEAGVVSLQDVENAIRPDTILLSVMHVNHEIGSIQPIEKIGELIKKHPKIIFHVDAVQSLGKIPLKLKDSGIDLCTFSAHKIHALNGTGALFINHKIKLNALFHGGEQEGKNRSGTENLAGVVAFAKALRLIKEQERTNILNEIHDFLYRNLAEIPFVKINSPQNGAPHIINISIPALKPETVIHKLGERGIYISTKSACSSKQNEPSRTVEACGFGIERAESALRISTSYENTLAEAKIFITELTNTVKHLIEVLQK